MIRKLIIIFTISFGILFSAEARISKSMKRPARLANYSVSLGGGEAMLYLSAVGCLGFCAGDQFEVVNLGDGVSGMLSFNLPTQPSTQQLDGEIYITHNCPATLAPAASCVVTVLLEAGGIYNGCNNQDVTVYDGKVSSTDIYRYGDCGVINPEI